MFGCHVESRSSVAPCPRLIRPTTPASTEKMELTTKSRSHISRVQSTTCARGGASTFEPFSTWAQEWVCGGTGTRIITQMFPFNQLTSANMHARHGITSYATLLNGPRPEKQTSWCAIACCNISTTHLLFLQSRTWLQALAG